VQLDHHLDSAGAAPLVWASSTRSTYLANLIAQVLSPPVVTTPAIALVAHASGSAAAWSWAIAFFAMAISVPVLYVWWLLRRGEISDFHIPLREQRYRPFLFTLVSSALALGVLAAGGAPRLLVVLATAAWVQGVILFLVTLRWKISAHCAAMASLATLAVGLLGAMAMPVLATVPLVAWSRLRLERHTLAQTVAGTALGIVVTAAAFPLLHL
jgi:membrane-associated phospholipid phosphatase